MASSPEQTSPERHRVLHITRNLPPLVGGMERLNWHIANELQKIADVHVVGPKGAAAVAPSGVEVAEAPIKPLWRFLFRATLRSLRLARQWRPRVVLAGSGLTAPMALFAARSCGAVAATYAHGLDLVVPNRMYRACWLPAIKRMDIVIVNSSATRELAVAAGIAQEKLCIIHPGVAAPPTVPTEESIARWRTGWGDLSGPFLLSVGRLTERKGLRQFVTDVLPELAQRHPNIGLIVVGGTATYSLHGLSQTPELILEAAAAKGVARNVRFAGLVSDEELAIAFSAADLHVFPVRQLPDDPEGFGMVAIEAATLGLATIAYRTGGIPDAVVEGISGTLVAPGDHVEFTRATLALLERTLSKDACRSFSREFSWDSFGRQLSAALLLNDPSRQA